MDAPDLGLEGLIACRVDFDEAGTGFLVLPSVERYRDLTSAADRARIDRSGISVVFASMEVLPKPMRRELDRFGWARSDDDRLPLLSKQGVDGEELVSTAGDYRAATLAASVMAHLAKSVGAALVDENEALHCTLQIPGAGPVEVLHPGDLDEDELGSIIEDRIEVNLIVPEEAITAAREVEFLSPKARGVLARARPSEARPGFEMRATLAEMAHLGEQLKAAAGQRGRSEILVEFATNVLMTSEAPDSMAAAPRPDYVPIVRDPEVTNAHARRGSRSPVPNRKTGARNPRLYRLKVTLRRISPPIWRRLEVGSGATLADLHHTIQAAMGWDDCHLHEFECRGKRFGPCGDESDYSDYSDYSDNDSRDEATTRLDEFLRKPRDSMSYLYDFGDGWEHRIVLESIDPFPTTGPPPEPRCIGGRRACPPEDCGGPGGYARMLQALRDPSDPEHETYAEWLGEEFDPDAF